MTYAYEATPRRSLANRRHVDLIAAQLVRAMFDSLPRAHDANAAGHVFAAWLEMRESVRAHLDHDEPS